MLTAQDVSYDGDRNIHTKWKKHQAFMAELSSNKDWLNKIDLVCVRGCVRVCVCKVQSDIATLSCQSLNARSTTVSVSMCPCGHILAICHMV